MITVLLSCMLANCHVVTSVFAECDVAVKRLLAECLAAVDGRCVLELTIQLLD